MPDSPGQQGPDEPPPEPIEEQSSGDITFLQTNTVSDSVFAATYDEVARDHGVRVLVALPPDGLVCLCSEAQRTSLAGDPRVVLLGTGIIPDVPSPPTGRPGDPGFAVQAWNAHFGSAPPDTTGNGEFIEPTPEFSEPQSDPERQTSLYLMGKVGVSLVFLESGATADPPCDALIEDWSQDEQIAAYTMVALVGLPELAQAAPGRAHVEFYAEVKYADTACEPITLPPSGYLQWIEESIPDIFAVEEGSTPDTYVWQMNNARREERKTDWWFTTFMIDDSCDSDKTFASENGQLPMLSFASMFGPCVNLLYDNGNYYHPDELDLVAMHEICHVFGAADEYSAHAGHCPDDGSCPNTTYGYMRVENWNCVNCEPHEACFMTNIRQFPSTCHYTLGQLGWLDSNWDGPLDPIDNYRSDRSMPVGSAEDPLTEGDWVDIRRDGAFARRLAVTDWSSDGGMMVWDGILWKGTIAPLGEYTWQRSGSADAHTAQLVARDEGPSVYDPEPEILSSDSRRIGFKFSDLGTGGSRIYATAVLDGQVRRFIDDEFLLDGGGTEPVSRVISGLANGNWFGQVKAWNVAGMSTLAFHFTVGPTADAGARKSRPGLVLLAPAPSPAGDTVEWGVVLESPDAVELRILGVDGRVLRLWPRRIYGAGRTRMSWDCRTGSGLRVAAGR